MAYRIKYLIGCLIFGLIFTVNIGYIDRDYIYMTDSLYKGFNFESLRMMFSFLFSLLVLGISVFYFFVLGRQAVLPARKNNDRSD